MAIYNNPYYKPGPGNAIITMPKPPKTGYIPDPNAPTQNQDPNDWMSGLDPAVQRILGRSVRPADIESLKTLRGESFGDDMTKWGQTQKTRQFAGESQLRDLAMGDLGSQRATSEAALAMRGGLSGGARERLAENLAQRGQEQMQRISQAGQMERTGLDVADEARKAAMRANIMGTDVDIAKLKSQQEMGALTSAYMSNLLGQQSGDYSPAQEFMPNTYGDYVQMAANPMGYATDKAVPGLGWGVDPGAKGLGYGTDLITGQKKGPSLPKLGF